MSMNEQSSQNDEGKSHSHSDDIEDSTSMEKNNNLDNNVNTTRPKQPAIKDRVKHLIPDFIFLSTNPLGKVSLNSLKTFSTCWYLDFHSSTVLTVGIRPALI